MRLPAFLLASLLILLLVAGGASRADTMGQVIVRAGAWAIIAAAVLGGPRPSLVGVRPVFILLLAVIALPLLQLIRVPPNVWGALPGRDILLTPGQPLPWRPATMTPGATGNALASLVIPATTLLVLTQTDERTRRWLLDYLLIFVAAAAILGLLQLSGSGFNNPLLNDTPGQVSGVFANRNHFALLVAIGCLVAPVWAFRDRAALGWRGPFAACLVILFVVTLLVIGSRTGIFVGVIAIIIALALTGRRLRQRLKGRPWWVFPTLVLMALVVIVGFVWISVAVERAESVARLFAPGAEPDLRRRILPTVLAMIATYFPFGSGIGGFETVFRIHEPDSLLSFVYFNQAHNDFLGIALDAGLPGILLLTAAVVWWLWATICSWRAEPSEEVTLARVGSAIIFLILAASTTDYPARTPTIMAVVVLAAFWLAQGSTRQRRDALPIQARGL